MKIVKTRRGEILLFSDELQRKLDRIPDYPLTVVEAPSGFGKTTAVREYLKGRSPLESRHWYTCLGESPACAWAGICGLFAALDGKIADRLRCLELPGPDALPALASIMRELRVEGERYLVIDNFQRIGTAAPDGLFQALAEHGSPGLHLIVITQSGGDALWEALRGPNIHTIRSDALAFDSQATAAYFRASGLALSKSELDGLCRSAEGWIAAIRLQMLNYRQTGAFQRTGEIDQLVRTAIWHRLPAMEREFLLSVCVLDSFTPRQACLLCGVDTLPENLLRLMEDNPFVRCEPAQGRYMVHSILQNYLRGRFFHCQPPEFQTRVLRRAGEAAASAGDYFSAAGFYRRVGDLDAALALPFGGTYLNDQKERDVLAFLTELLEDCSDELLARYPQNCIAFAFQFFMSGQIEPFGRLCGLLGRLLEENRDMAPGDRRRLAGELALLESFRAYNHIPGMSRGHRTALEYLNGPSAFLRKTTSWTVMNVSVLWMFWREPGGLDRELAQMDECMPLYNRLASGHGCGAEIVMRAEALLLRGRDKEAETLCHQARYVTRSEDQIGLTMCAELCLARAALLQGDAAALAAAGERCEALAEATPDRFTRRMSELCRTWLALTVGRTEETPDWLLDPARMERVLYKLSLPLGQMLYGRYLLLTGRLEELCGLIPPMCDAAEKLHCLLAQVYHLLHLAAARRALGETDRARRALEQALALALPDGMLLPFAELGGYLGPLLDEAAAEDGGRELRALCRRQAAGVQSAMAPMLGRLTRREREIAALAQKRLTAREIAVRLFISESTVRSALKAIYGKLEIHSKAELTEFKL